MCRILLFIFILLPTITFSQQANDFPSDLPYFKNNNIDTGAVYCDGILQKHWQIIGDSMVKEFYCDSNIHAEGPVFISNVTSYINPDNSKGISKEYHKTGYWKVYFDSYDKIIRSEGSYKNGKMDGLWIIYYPNGKHNHEIIYSDDIIKQHTEIDESGKRTLIESNTDTTIFLIKNKSSLIILVLIPLMIVRPIVNIITYNKLNKTQYIPMFQNWQKGGWAVGLEMIMTFWWMPRKHETKEIKNYILSANIICFISVIITLGFIILYTFWGPAK